MVTIHDSDNKAIRKSRNLRGLLDYAREHSICRLSIYERNEETETSAYIYVGFTNGAWCCVNFADYRVLRMWVSARRVLRGAPLTVNGIASGEVTKDNPAML